ncbi:MAG: hypothetical protein IJG54_00540 [Bacteroidales bacterium]|nr:hypothetical protein [Bacteroidales bacterium]
MNKHKLLLLLLTAILAINIIIFIAFSLPIVNKSTCSDNIRLSNVSIYSNTPIKKLAYFVKNQDTLSIRLFLSHNKDVNIDTPDPYFGCSLLLYAIYNEKLLSTEQLLKLGANPNIIDHQGKCPLLYASLFLSDGSKFIKVLMKYGADPTYNPSGEKVNNPLYWAPLKISDIKAYIESGLDIKDTTISHLILSQSYDIETKHYLICEKGIDPNFNYYSSFIKGLRYDTIIVDNYERIMRLCLDGDTNSIKKKQEIISYSKEFREK